MRKRIELRQASSRKDKRKADPCNGPALKISERQLRPSLLLLSQESPLLLRGERIRILISLHRVCATLLCARALLLIATHHRLLPQFAQFYALIRGQHLQDARLSQRPQADCVCLRIGNVFRPLRNQIFVRCRGLDRFSERALRHPQPHVRRLAFVLQFTIYRTNLLDLIGTQIQRPKHVVCLVSLRLNPVARVLLLLGRLSLQ